MSFSKNSWMTLIILAVTFHGDHIMAVEEAEYSVVKQAGDFELRDYAASIVAEILVDDDFERAGNRAFRPLFKYISGDNETREEISMTSPVAQEKRSEAIAMTAPVSQTESSNGWAVSFMMPAEYTMDTIPQPSNSLVKIRELSAYRAAVIRFSGRWTGKNYSEHLAKLNTWIVENGLQVKGEPVWARYDPPFKPWFLRRNEILISVF